MARRRTVPKRRRIFVGAEGESERSFAKWLSDLCEKVGLHVHLDIRVCGGGDGFNVVEYSVEQYRQRKHHGPYSAALVVLDADRIEEDRSHGRDPLTALGNEKLRLIFLKPNIEGLLCRLHRGHESRFGSASEAKGLLQRLWPEYAKPTSAEMLGRRFELGDLRRAARHDTDLRQALELLGLWRAFKKTNKP